MTSRKPGGDAFTPAPGGWDFRPYGYLVIMVLMTYASFTKPAILKYYYLFRQNESHLLYIIIGRLALSEFQKPWQSIVKGNRID